MPYAWAISEICKEFSCLPSAAEAELARDEERDDPLLPEILDLRHFAEAKRVYDEHVRDGKPIENPSPLLKDVMILDAELFRERKERR